MISIQHPELTKDRPERTAPGAARDCPNRWGDGAALPKPGNGKPMAAAQQTAALIVRELIGVAEAHGATFLGREDRRDALQHDLATVISGAGSQRVGVELELRDDGGRAVARCRVEVDAGSIHVERDQRLAAAPVVRYRLRLDGISARHLSLLAHGFRLRWRRGANSRRPEAARPPAVGDARRHTLRINNWGCRGYGFADALDGSFRNVFCHVRYAPQGFRLQIGNLITARLVTTEQGVQAREIAAASAARHVRRKDAA